MDHNSEEIFLQLQKLNLQVGRLVSDFESEKEHRKELGKQVRYLEVDKIKRDTTYKNIRVLWSIISALSGALITIIINHFLK